MRITIDESRCIASGNCLLNAPQIFSQRESDGTAIAVNEKPAPDQQALAREVADMCPVSAIIIDDA